MKKKKIKSLTPAELKAEVDKFKKPGQSRFSLAKVLRYLLYFLTLVYQLLKAVDDDGLLK